MTSPATIPSAGSSARSRWLGLGAVAVMLLVATIAMPVWASATTVRTDEDVNVAVNESIVDDLFVLADTFSLDGTARRDVFVAARTIDIAGVVGGTVNAVGGEITISGPVTGSVRVAGGTATLTGSIGGDLFIAGGTVTVEPRAVVEGDVHLYGGSVDLQGTVRGDVKGAVGTLDLEGTVDGSVLVDVDALSLAATSEIAGDLNYVSPSAADIATGAQVTGGTDHRTIAPWGIDDSLRGRFFSPLVRTVWLLVTGAIIVALAPRVVAATNSNLRRPFVAALTGLVSLVAVPIVAVVLAVTIVGLPASLILLTVWVIALYLSQLVVGQRLGALLMPRTWNDGSRGYLLLSMTIGVLLLSTLRYVPLPYVGQIVNALVAVVGLGGSVLLLRQVRPGYSAV